MLLKRLNTSRGWKDVLLETGISAASKKLSIPQVPGRLSAEQLREITVRWPATYQCNEYQSWLEPLLFAFSRIVKTELREVSQQREGILPLQVVISGEVHDVVLDYSDYSALAEPLVDRCLLYLKMQYRPQGYGLDHVVPAGHVPASVRLYLHLASLRAEADKRVYDSMVYGRFNPDLGGDVRKRAVHILKEQKTFPFEGGLVKKKYFDYLKEMTHAKVCIDLPGNGDICNRLIEYFAIGSCVVRPRKMNLLPAPLIDRQHIAYVQDDFSDLVEVCDFYLRNDDAREELRRNSRQYFDEYLHRNNLAAYYLWACWQRLAAN